MADSTIKIEGLDKVMKKVKSLEDLEGVKAGLRAAGLHVKGRLAQYPPRKKITIQSVGGWASDAQRRWFFAALNSDQIDVPYRRGQSPGSEDLGQKWTIKERDRGLTVVVGNNVSYGQFVMDEDKQSRMHRAIGWKTTQKIAAEESGKVNEMLINEVNRALERA